MDLRDRMDNQDIALLVGGLVLGMVLAAVGTWLVVSPKSDAGSRSGDAPFSAAEPLPTLEAQHQTPQGRKARCLAAADAVKSPLHRAASSVDQWEVHVGAMNKLVLGAITLQQASAFWSQTRIGARERIAGFDRAWRRLQHQGVDCPSPTLLPAGARPEVRSCARKVALDMRVLQVARTALGTWGRHVRAMERLRMGTMSPSTASRMWLMMWQRGQHEINTYRLAAHAARKAPGCTAARSLSASSSP